MIITVRREEEGKINDFDVTIQRDVIPLESVEHEMLDEDLGYIRISSFEEPTEEEFKEAMDDLIDRGAQGLYWICA